MELTQTLFSAFKEVTGAYKEKNKDTSIIKFLDKAIKAIDGVIKGMDAFLKKKGVDLGKTYSDSKNAAKGLIDRAKESLGKDSDGNSRSYFKGLKDKGSDIAGKMLGKFSGFRTSGTPPPEGQVNLANTDEPKDDRSLLEKTAGTFDKLVDKVGLLLDGVSSKKPDDINGDGVSEEGWIEKFKGRQNKRKKEVEDEKAALAARSKKDKKGGKGPFGWIADKLMSLGGMLIGGVWSVGKFLSKSLLKGFGRATWWLGKKLISGFGRLLTGLVPSLSGGLAKALQGLIGGGLKGAGNLALKGLKAVGRNLLPMAARALPFVARGAAMLLSGPVGWAVAAGTLIYGGYKLYKYMTRNDISDNIYGKLTRLRLLTYGFNDDNKESFSKVFELEMMMKDNLSFNAQDFKLTIKPPDKDQTEKVMEIFGIQPEEKERREILNAWFSKRFIPAYHAYIRALYSVNTSIFIDDLEKLNPADIETFLSRYNLAPQIYDQTKIPFFENPTTTVKKEDVETTLTAIKQENKLKLKRSQLTPEERMKGEIAKKKTEEMTSKVVKESLNKAMPAAFPMNTQRSVPSPFPIGKGPVPEGEHKPDQPLLMMANAGSAMSGVNKAEGPIVPGDSSLPGITTKLKREAIFNLDPNVFNLFTGMAKEYHSLTGKTIQVNDGWRSREEQERLFKKYPPGRAARPGKSPHEFGLAIDINTENTKELEKLGLLRKYGFTASIGGESWHLEPIGVSLDPEKAKHDLNYRKDAVLSSVGKGGGGFGLVQGSKLGTRNIELQRKIYGGSVPEKSPEAIASDPLTSATIASSAGPASQAPTGSPVVPPLLKPTSEAVAASSNPQPAVPDLLKPSTATIASSSVIANTSTEGEPKPDSGGLVKASMGAPGYASSTMDLSRYSDMSAVEAIKQASMMTGVDEETLMTFGKLESSLQTGSANSKSTASGLFQITGTTWKELVAKHGPKYGIPPDADKNNPLYNALMAAEYAKSNLNRVAGHEQLGISKDVALYLTHHFGPSGGQRIIKAYASNPNADVTTAVSADAFASNKEALSGQTVASYLSSLNNKFSIAKNTSVEAYKPTGGGYASSVMASKPEGDTSGFMQASYTQPVNVEVPKPTVATAAYDVTRVESSNSNQNYQSQSVSPEFNTTNMEGILNNQLTTLTQIATVLGSINDKIDIEALAKAFSGASPQQNPSQAAPRTATVPSTGVNMSRKPLVT